jgi:hypothetical protein
MQNTAKKKKFAFGRVSFFASTAGASRSPQYRVAVMSFTSGSGTAVNIYSSHGGVPFARPAD